MKTFTTDPELERLRQIAYAAEQRNADACAESRRRTQELTDYMLTRVMGSGPARIAELLHASEVAGKAFSATLRDWTVAMDNVDARRTAIMEGKA